MPEKPINLGAQFRGDTPEAVEQESVRTTIVGGRPPGSGQPLGPLPRGIEILLKKASVDPDFRRLLLDNPESAVQFIELNLDPVEQSMLRLIPRQQLETIINQVDVPQSQRRAFLGTAATAMFAVLTGSQTALAEPPMAPGGCVVRRPPVNDNPDEGNRPDVPPFVPPNVPPARDFLLEVRILVTKTLGITLDRVEPTTPLLLEGQELNLFRQAIYRDFDVRMPLKTLSTLRTVKLLTDYIAESHEGYEVVRRPFRPAGIRPFPPPAGASSK